MVKAVVVHELTERLDVGLGRAREAHDEGRAERDARYPLSNACEERIVVLPRSRALHSLEYRIRRVLQGQVDVLAHPVALGHRGKRLVVDRRRIEIQEANPFEAVNGIERAQESSKRVTLVPVVAVERGVLRDEENLFDALRDQRSGLLDDRLGRTAAVVAPERRDDAERAFVVAALSHLYIGVVPRGGEYARSARIVDIRRKGFGILDCGFEAGKRRGVR